MRKNGQIAIGIEYGKFFVEKKTSFSNHREYIGDCSLFGHQFWQHITNESICVGTWYLISITLPRMNLKIWLIENEEYTRVYKSHTHERFLFEIQPLVRSDVMQVEEGFPSVHNNQEPIVIND